MCLDFHVNKKRIKRYAFKIQIMILVKLTLKDNIWDILSFKKTLKRPIKGKKKKKKKTGNQRNVGF